MSTITFKQRATIHPRIALATLVALLALAAAAVTVPLVATSGSSSTGSSLPQVSTAAIDQAYVPLIEYRGTGAPPASLAATVGSPGVIGRFGHQLDAVGAARQSASTPGGRYVPAVHSYGLVP